LAAGHVIQPGGLQIGQPRFRLMHTKTTNMKSPAALSCHGIHTFSYSAPQRCTNSLTLKTQKWVFMFKKWI